MRRLRNKDATKVWHNPELNTFSRRGGGNGGVAAHTESVEDRRSAKQHRAALEALFAPKPTIPADAGGAGGGAGAAGSSGNGSSSGTRASSNGAAKGNGRIVLAPAPQSDPRTDGAAEAPRQAPRGRGAPQDLQGRRDDFFQGRLHAPGGARTSTSSSSSTRTRSACAAPSTSSAPSSLRRAAQAPRRVLESRLRRIEQFADEADTRARRPSALRRRGRRPETPGQA